MMVRLDNRAATAVALAGPLAAMLVFRVMVGDPVSSASAGVAHIDPLAQQHAQLAAAASGEPTTPVTPAQRTLVESGVLWSEADDMAGLASPMREMAAAIDDQPEAPEPDDPAVEVSSIMGAGQRVFATINGRVHRVGDAVAEGWTITSIDQAARRVIITRDADGRRLELVMGR